MLNFKYMDRILLISVLFTNKSFMEENDIFAKNEKNSGGWNMEL